jgi:Flp pilus assembly protein TadB
MIDRMIEWLRKMRREHGYAVSLLAALVLLLGLTLALALVMALFAGMMLIHPYLPLVVGLGLISYLILKPA